MAIKKFHDLPEGREERDPGHPPSEQLFILGPALELWHEQLQMLGELPMSVAGRKFRASWAALACDKQLAYAIEGAPPSNPPSVADSWRMEAGSFVHRQLAPIVEAVMEKLGCTADCERAIDLRLGLDLDGSATADWVVEWGPSKSPTGADRTVVELKSINGFGFKRHVVGFKGSTVGPRRDHVVQASLSAASLAHEAGDNVDVCIAYLSLELISASIAKSKNLSEIQRFAAEWWFDTAEVISTAEEEAFRVEAVLRAVAKGDPVRRLVRDHELIANPMLIIDPSRGTAVVYGPEGEIQQTDQTWRCAYCRQKQRCIEELRQESP